MKIAIIGATGFIGTHILKEAVERGHYVTAIVRNIEKLEATNNVLPVKADINNNDELTKAVTDHDAVISAFNPAADGIENSPNGLKAFKSIIDAVTRSNVNRLLVVGGAGSLKVLPGIDLVDSEGFNKEWRPGAVTTRTVLKYLKEYCKVDWTMLSPSALIKPDKNTGSFRLGLDNLLMDENGKSWISSEDYSVAMIDELEDPKHTNRRFTVGY